MYRRDLATEFRLVVTQSYETAVRERHGRGIDATYLKIEGYWCYH